MRDTEGSNPVVYPWNIGLGIVSHIGKLLFNLRRIFIMAFFQSAVGVLQTLVVALGAGLGIWGAINLMEGYGNDNPGANR